MPNVYKVLGQVAPSATTETTLYTCPSNTQTIVSSLVVCNRSATARTYRISVRPDGASLANQHYIAYDATVPANDTIALSLGISINDADVISVYASTTDLSFNLYGCEIS